MALPQTKSGITRGKQIIVKGIGVMEGISGGLGNLPWGFRHWGRVWGCLRGPSWHLLTLTARGWFSRGGGNGGARALPLLLLPVHIDKPPRCLSTNLQIILGAPALPLWICSFFLHLHIPMPLGFLLVRFLGVMPALPIGGGRSWTFLPSPFKIFYHIQESSCSLSRIIQIQMIISFSHIAVMWLKNCPSLSMTK